MSEENNQVPPQQPPPPPPQPEVQAAGVPNSEERTWGMLAHLAALSAIITGLGAIVGPLIVWLIKKDTMPFVDDQGKEATNFGITCAGATFLLFLVGTPLLLILIGFLFYLAAFVVMIYWLVFTIIAAIKANEGVAYRYPVTLRLIK
ncbi:MAG: DUF4870 domain-containing protein [Lysobacteraceae bacterium]|jgi:hypothetical protein